MSDLSDIVARLAVWHSRGNKWKAELVRNRAGAWLVMEYKRAAPDYYRSCGCMTRPAGHFPDDVAALAWARETVPSLFDVPMTEASASHV